MSLVEDMVALWGRDGLTRAPRGAVESLDIPAAAKAFLSEVGLPRKEILLINYDLDAKLPIIEDHAASRKQSLPPGAKQGYLIGTGATAPDFFLLQDGSIVEVELGPKGWVRFVNSNLDALAIFLIAFQKSLVRDEMSNEENRACVRRIKKDLVPMDPVAFSKPDHWWPLVFEQMEDGVF